MRWRCAPRISAADWERRSQGRRGRAGASASCLCERKRFLKRDILMHVLMGRGHVLQRGVDEGELMLGETE
jgi:hypothetical protein